MSNWYWHTRYAPSEEPIAALLARKEYELQRWLESPLISRWLANEAAGATAAAEIRLTTAIASVRASSIAMAAVDLATTARIAAPDMDTGLCNVRGSIPRGTDTC